MSNVGAFVIFLVTSTMVIVFVNHRNALERERQAELQLANQRLRESEIFLEKRVEERTFELQIAKEVAEFARERAEEADRTKSQFLASMSHELRTPLNSILTFNELLMMEAMGPVNEEQKDFLGKTLESGRHLLSLINDVLDITKLSAGMMQMNTETAVDLRSDIASVYSTAESLLKHKPDVKLVMDIDDPLPTVTADRRRIRQIMLNLVSNAGKFTEEGTITISAKRRGADFLFAVIDTGPGIPEAHHEAIFEPFVQTETGVKHAAGTGLGLAIARRLTEAHQGKLWLESEAGQGAAFYFTIPAEPVRVEKSA
jgi:signal transduction histidine kinase